MGPNHQERGIHRSSFVLKVLSRAEHHRDGEFALSKVLHNQVRVLDALLLVEVAVDQILRRCGAIRVQTQRDASENLRVRSSERTI